MAGYIGTIPVPQSTQTRQSFTATASQTTFATAGYTAGFVDVYMNGVHLLDGTDYTATNGSDIVLTTGAAAGDVIEVVAYSTYQVNSQNYTGGLTVDNDGATVLTVDRATSDGTIIDFQKNGTTVGSIGTGASELFVGNGDVNLTFNSLGDNIYPSAAGSTSVRDAAVDLGLSFARFKDLYLSGGVYLGGTGAANKLDDYEEGTFTASWKGTSAAGTPSGGFAGKYIKIGNLVCCYIAISGANLTGASGNLRITGLPFTASSTFVGGGTGNLEGITPSYTYTVGSGSHVQLYAAGGTTELIFRVGMSAAWDNYLLATSTFTSGGGATYGNLSFSYQAS